MTKRFKPIGLLRTWLSYSFVAIQIFAAQPDHAVVGVYPWYTPPSMSQQDMIHQLPTNGVKTILKAMYAGSTDFTAGKLSLGPMRGAEGSRSA